MRFKNNNSGVSMLTLVITVVVIIILALVAFGNSTRTVEEANYSTYQNNFSEVETFFEKTSVDMHGTEELRENNKRNEQIYNYVAKGGKTEEDFLSVSELPSYTVIEPDADIGIKLPVTKVESGTGKMVPIKYASTKKGQIFTWPPYDYNDEYYITKTDTVEHKMQTQITVGSETFEIVIDPLDGTLKDFVDDNKPSQGGNNPSGGNGGSENTPDQHTHDFSSKTTSDEYLKSEANCDSPATYYYKCAECDEKGTNTYTVGNAQGHSYGAWSITSTANCKDEGIKSRKCTKCNHAETDSVAKNPANHSGGETASVTTPATCAEEGVKSYKCAGCKEVLRTETIAIDLNNHSGKESSSVTTVATCAKEGVKTIKCADCNEVLRTETIEQDASKHGNKTKEEITKAATCAEPGEKTVKCADCSATLRTETIEKLSTHGSEKSEVTKKATCTATGVRTFKCSVCNETLRTETISKDSSNHDGSEIVGEVKDPTCTEAGSKQYKCSGCNMPRRTEEIKATGHKYVTQIKKEATCTEEGLLESVCETCKTIETTSKIPSLGHADTDKNEICDRCNEDLKVYTLSANWMLKDHIVDKTISQNIKFISRGIEYTNFETYFKSPWYVIKYGNTEIAKGEPDEYVLGWYMKWIEQEDRILKFGDAPQEVSKEFYTWFTANATEVTDHIFSEYTETKAPTCTAKGTKTRKCIVCGETETAEIAALGHDYKAVITAPTCKAQGYTTHTCTRCNDSYKDTYTNKLSHTWGSWLEITAATCTTNGEEGRKCSACGTTETRTVVANGHDYKERITEATCTEKGYKTYICDECGDTYVDDYTDALEHIDADGNNICDVCGEDWNEYTLSGTWAFNIPRSSRADLTQDINFSVNGEEYYKIKLEGSEIAYVNTRYTYYSSFGLDHWVNLGDNVLYFGETPQSVSKAFYEWFTANAQKYTDELSGVWQFNEEMTLPTRTIAHKINYKAASSPSTKENYNEIRVQNDAIYFYKESSPWYCIYGSSNHWEDYIKESVIDFGSELQVVSPEFYEWFIANATKVTDHIWDEYTETTAATCTAKGVKTRTCIVCGETETAEIAALGHDYKAEVTAATCKAQGYTTHTCTRCNDSYKDTYTNKLSHTWGSWLEITVATCTTDGEEGRKCSACGTTETRTVISNGHDYKERITEATCTEEGYTTHICDECGDTYVDGYTDALGHIDANKDSKCDRCGEVLKVLYGKWKFNEHIPGTVTIEQSINYSSKGNSYTSMTVKNTLAEGIVQISCIYYVNGTTSTAVYATGYESWSPNNSNTYQIVDFGTTPQIVSEEFYAWFVANASHTAAHECEEYTETTAATCTTAGVEEGICVMCGKTVTKEIPALGHIDSNTDNICDRCGVTIKEVEDLGNIEISDPDAEITYDPDTGEMDGVIPPSEDEPEPTPEEIPEEKLPEMIAVGYGKFKSNTTYTPGTYEDVPFEQSYTVNKYPVTYSNTYWSQWKIKKDAEGNVISTEPGDIKLENIEETYSTWIVYDFETEKYLESNGVKGDTVEIWTIFNPVADTLENAVYLAAYLNKLDGKTSRHIAKHNGTNYVAYDADSQISAVKTFTETYTITGTKRVEITAPSSTTNYVYIPVGELRAEKGMTWAKWLESEYNTTGETNPIIKTEDFEDVAYSDLIEEGVNYGFVVYELSGRWIFNDEITIPNSTIVQKISFNEGSWNLINVGYKTIIACINSNCVLCNDNGACYDSIYLYDDMWLESKNIDFGSTPQTVSKEFYEWFTANATQQEYKLEGTWYLNDTVEWFDTTYNFEYMIPDYAGDTQFVGFNGSVLSSTGYATLKQPFITADGRIYYWPLSSTENIRTWKVLSTINEVTEATGSTTAGKDLYDWFCANATKVVETQIGFVHNYDVTVPYNVFEYEVGMTWKEFVASEYNIDLVTSEKLFGIDENGYVTFIAEATFCPSLVDEFVLETDNIKYPTTYAYEDEGEKTAYFYEIAKPNCNNNGHYYETYHYNEKEYCVRCGEAICEGHVFVTEVTEPTCTKGGYAKHTCEVCNLSYIDSRTDKDSKNHNYGEYKIVSNATCTTAGSQERKCTRCGNVDTAEIAALGHSYTSKETAPTCTSAGYTTYTCSICKNSYTGNNVAKLGHNYKSVVTAATCLADGYTTYTCTRCSNSYTGNTVEALGHADTNGDEKCDRCSIAMKVYKLSGKWMFNEGPMSNTTITLPSKTIIQKINYSYGQDYTGYTGDGFYVTSSGITFDGDKEDTMIPPYSELGWDMSFFLYVDFGSEAQKVSQEFYEWFTANAVCTTEMQIGFLHPGDMLSEYTAFEYPVGITWGEFVDSKYNVELGTSTKLFGETSGGYIEYLLVSGLAAPVNYTTKVKSDDAMAYSTVCVYDMDYIYYADDLIELCEAIGHVATIEYNGEEYCVRCGTVIFESTTECTHTYNSSVTAATCTTEGYTRYTCSKCNDTYTANEIAALGHSDTNSDGKCDRCSIEMKVYKLSGKWKLDVDTSTAEYFSSEINEDINYIVNDTNYTNMMISSFIVENKKGFILSYNVGTDSFLVLAYGYKDTEMYNQPIDFGTTSQVVSKEFYEWFTTNAKKDVNLITFAIYAGDPSVCGEFQAEEGMTWGDWLDSEYNTIGLYYDEEWESICNLVDTYSVQDWRMDRIDDILNQTIIPMDDNRTGLGYYHYQWD